MVDEQSSDGMNDDREWARPEEVFSRRASFYATSKVHDDQGTLAWLVELARPKESDLVLDVGTGTGHTAMALAPLVRQVEAIDLTEEMLEEGRGLCRQRGISNVRFDIGDAMALPFPDGSFDIVTCRRAAHHFRDVRRALGEMARVLRAGGRLVIDDRSVPEDDEVDRAINQLDILHDPSHVRDYLASEWRTIIEGAGLELVSTRMYRKRMSLSHFTTMVDADTAGRMRDLIGSMSTRVKEAVELEERDGDLLLDNFFVILAAIKP